MSDEERICGFRKSTLATLEEIVQREKKFKEETGIDIADEGEWRLLRDFVIRIEKRWQPKTSE